MTQWLGRGVILNNQDAAIVFPDAVPEPECLSSLRLVRLRCQLRAVDDLAFHSFPASTFRRFYAALHHSMGCEGWRKDTPCAPGCFYRSVFSSGPRADLPRDLREHPPAALAIDFAAPRNAVVRRGEPLALEIMLVGRSTAFYGPILQRVYEVGVQGLGSGRARFELESVHAAAHGGPRLVHTSAGDAPISVAPELTWEDIKTCASSLRPDGIRIEFTQPTRLEWSRSQPGGIHIHFAELARVCVARLRSVLLAHCLDGDLERHERDLSLWREALLDLAPAVEVDCDLTDWRPQVRVDHNDPDKYVCMPGATGSVWFSGPLQPFLPLLAASELLQIGKHTSYGNGRFIIGRSDLSL